VIGHTPVLIIGAGPAGLAAAYELVQHDIHPLVLEKNGQVGGIARTEVYKGYRFDIGGHRFFTKVAEVEALWDHVLGSGFLQVPRLSRIYHRQRFFPYPLKLYDTLLNLGIWESALILLSYIRARLRPSPREDTFEQWVTNRFGRRLYRTFFKGYTEKVWGIPCDQIQADWAAQRIHGLSLTTAVLNALFGTENAKSLISEFRYPRLGPGMMWERFAEQVTAGGGQVDLNAHVIRLHHDGHHVLSATIEQGADELTLSGDSFLSSMPLSELIIRLDPLPPDDVLEAARALRYRSFLLVGLIVKRANLFPDNWLYIQSPEVQVGRIQNVNNWSPALVPDPQTTGLGMEYFCDEGDRTWTAPDAELVALATRELAQLGLAESADVAGGAVFRQPKAYPLYDSRYRGNLQILRRYLKTLDNLQTIGRNGMHRYNNMDHSMITGLLAARNVLGENHDLWSVNTEQSYIEEISAAEGPRERQ